MVARNVRADIGGTKIASLVGMATFLISMIGFCAAWALIAIVLGLLLGSLFYNSDEGAEVRG